MINHVTEGPFPQVSWRRKVIRDAGLRKRLIFWYCEYEHYLHMRQLLFCVTENIVLIPSISIVNKYNIHFIWSGILLRLKYVSLFAVNYCCLMCSWIVASASGTRWHFCWVYFAAVKPASTGNDAFHFLPMPSYNTRRWATRAKSDRCVQNASYLSKEKQLCCGEASWRHCCCANYILNGFNWTYYVNVK